MSRIAGARCIPRAAGLMACRSIRVAVWNCVGGAVASVTGMVLTTFLAPRPVTNSPAPSVGVSVTVFMP